MPDNNVKEIKLLTFGEGGNIIYIGEFDEENKLSGRGIFIAHQFRYDGFWEKTERNGFGRSIIPSQNNNNIDFSIHEGYYNGGKYQGEGVWINDKLGLFYYGNYKEGKCHGQGKYVSPTETYTGEFAKHKRHGTGKEVISDGHFAQYGLS